MNHSPLKKQWHPMEEESSCWAMEDKIASLRKNETWELVPLIIEDQFAANGFIE